MEYVQPIRDKKALDTMKKILRSNNLRDYCLFILGINSGLRISDLLTLKVSDVCDEKGKIKDRIVIREKKTNKLKDFPLGETSKKALKEYVITLKPTQALFASRKGYKPINKVVRDSEGTVRLPYLLSNKRDEIRLDLVVSTTTQRSRKWLRGRKKSTDGKLFS